MGCAGPGRWRLRASPRRRVILQDHGRCDGASASSVAIGSRGPENTEHRTPNKDREPFREPRTRTGKPNRSRTRTGNLSGENTEQGSGTFQGGPRPRAEQGPGTFQGDVTFHRATGFRRRPNRDRERSRVTSGFTPEGLQPGPEAPSWKVPVQCSLSFTLQSGRGPRGTRRRRSRAPRTALGSSERARSRPRPGGAAGERARGSRDRGRVPR